MLALVYKNINDGDRLPLHRSMLKSIAAHQLEDKHPVPHVSTTVFNVLRAAVQVLSEEMGYITAQQLKLIEYLIDRNDVSLGAAFEVYLQTEDLEDLVHSLLCIIKVKHYPQADNKTMVDSDN